MKTFVIADTHFNHANIIKYCNRPFADTYEMEETLVENWNSIVKPEDEVYVLGDFALGDRSDVGRILSRLNGTKYLALGNHDNATKATYLKAGFKEVFYKKRIGRVDMRHHPLNQDELMQGFIFYLYGHVHDKPGFDETPNSKCVSVERINYTPYDITELLEKWK